MCGDGKMNTYIPATQLLTVTKHVAVVLYIPYSLLPLFCSRFLSQSWIGKRSTAALKADLCSQIIYKTLKEVHDSPYLPQNWVRYLYNQVFLVSDRSFKGGWLSFKWLDFWLIKIFSLNSLICLWWNLLIRYGLDLFFRQVFEIL